MSQVAGDRAQCLLGVKPGHSVMSAQCPVCPKADTAGRFMSTRPSVMGPLMSTVP
jgi:hypothetical protein